MVYSSLMINSQPTKNKQYMNIVIFYIESKLNFSCIDIMTHIKLLRDVWSNVLEQFH